jgi:hypothetical protein
VNQPRTRLYRFQQTFHPTASDARNAEAGDLRRESSCFANGVHRQTSKALQLAPAHVHGVRARQQDAVELCGVRRRPFHRLQFEQGDRGDVQSKLLGAFYGTMGCWFWAEYEEPPHPALNSERID